MTYKMDENLRVLECPNCKNEEFSKEADYCRICGHQLYNYCEGHYDGWQQEHVTHKNAGNARYCETCGTATFFLNQGYLEEWDAHSRPKTVTKGKVVNLRDDDLLDISDDDLPF